MFKNDLPIGEISPEIGKEYVDYIWEEYQKEMGKSNPSENGFQKPIDDILNAFSLRNIDVKIVGISEIDAELYSSTIEEYEYGATSSDIVNYSLIIDGKSLNVSVTQQAFVKIEVDKNHKIKFNVAYPNDELFVSASIDGEEIELNDLWDDEEDTKVLLDSVIDK